MKLQDLQVGDAYICKGGYCIVLITHKNEGATLACVFHFPFITTVPSYCLCETLCLEGSDMNNEEFISFPRKKFEQLFKMFNQFNTDAMAIINSESNGN